MKSYKLIRFTCQLISIKTYVLIKLLLYRVTIYVELASRKQKMKSTYFNQSWAMF